jgi:hypothetical protein
MLDDLHLPAEPLLDESAEAAFVVSTIDPNELEAGKATLERFKQEVSSVVILDIGLMHQLMEH